MASLYKENTYLPGRWYHRDRLSGHGAFPPDPQSWRAAPIDGSREALGPLLCLNSLPTTMKER